MYLFRNYLWYSQPAALGHLNGSSLGHSPKADVYCVTTSECFVREGERSKRATVAYSQIFHEAAFAGTLCFGFLWVREESFPEIYIHSFLNGLNTKLIEVLYLFNTCTKFTGVGQRFWMMEWCLHNEYVLRWATDLLSNYKKSDGKFLMPRYR